MRPLHDSDPGGPEGLTTWLVQSKMLGYVLCYKSAKQGCWAVLMNKKVVGQVLMNKLLQSMT